MSNIIKKRAFRHDDGCSECPIKKGRKVERERLTKEIEFLNSMGISTPKAEANLEKIQGRIRDCAFGRCETHK